jgi:hypothetical protein
MIPNKPINKWGIIPKVFTEEQLLKFKDVFIKCKSETSDEFISAMHGIDINSVAYPWFIAKMWPIVLEQFENKSIKLIHSMYASFRYPFKIHDDAYKEIPRNTSGNNYVSCLIPTSVDSGKSNFGNIHTIILNEEQNPNAKEDYEKYLSHCELDQVEQYTIDGICTWSLGDMIWWDSHKPHSSSNFTVNHASKECIVIHTYV